MRSITNQWRKLVYLCMCATLLACGGGGSDEPPRQSLFVNAGVDRQVSELSTFTLSGQVQTNSSSLTYVWSSSPVITIDHPDRSVPDATVTAPATTELLPYTFTLRVTDESGNSASDEVVITVAPVNEAPVADIQLDAWPGLDPGVFPAGETLLLDGSGSVDPDDTSINAIIAYEWQQIAGQNVLSGVVTDAATLSITTPIAIESQTLGFRLTVTDTELASASTDISLNIQSESDTLPLVNAGFDHAVFSGESIILNGSASTSVPRGLPLTVEWRNDTGEVLDIDQPSNVSTFATAPDVETPTTLIISLSVTDAFGNNVEDSINVSVQQQPLTALNDTGVIQQATEEQITAVHQNQFPGQDGQRGQDKIAESGLLEKAGRGLQGFDFTRLNQNGDEVDDVTQPWRCVRDNITGYVWEIKTAAAGLHATDNLYSWYQEEDNGGFEGERNGADTVCTLAECNTSAYIAAVNAEGLCGFFDWRLPSHDELLSIVHYGVINTPLVDESYFPETGQLSQAPLWYWTVQPNADGVQDEEAQAAWAIDFATGVDNFLNKRNAARIRLVRAGRP
ncbi:DUF1566 domain-containing protein [Alteromonas sp. ASW11-36]|uniref:DUF1566 domain-containing protein n=1 Tax=Alteromonas arenosi TaxID=3055817 RepID=A0ABT7T135_9ALTE|nr:DUF1566 domain-containing protein [Alteromonas sp. ASW11-36]MDM7861934.1 DUF1566 domain-containing protein [Alteromonas sp. ASW11-36]